MVLKILVSFDLPEVNIREIRSVSPEVQVRKESKDSALIDAVGEAEILFTGEANREMITAAPKLRWIHSWGAGVDRLLSIPEMARGSIILTNSSGIHSIQISEHVIGLMLIFTRKLKEFILFQNDGVWHVPDETYIFDELKGKTVGIIGLGSIGSEIAKKAKCFGMTVLAIRRTITAKPTFVDELLPSYDLKRLLKESDFVVISAPLTSKTRGMIGAQEFANMKRTAYIINIARGEIIQQNELIAALKQKKIAGAGLDVFETEPLQPNSDLWHMKNVIITPHVAGETVHYYERTTKIFCENLRRYINKTPLINVVDKKAGY
ncbi:MAG: D-2-hydroxyacid dehydrogenase [Candidatus Bathyarchaeota archaeon]|jgi:phosphoglycerate dehydrogenase-like enzyme